MDVLLRWSLHAQNLVIREDLSSDSNHKFMIFSCQISTANSCSLPPKRVLWDLALSSAKPSFRVGLLLSE
ncbi:hypothetical protein RO3G_06772 [Rhizopus delemar RA 99-880]|uniref:Uncharacterized protein n=1 Tax=Rhizopus delemar (strain RA 99-880 / ATCC MYA-4621 / FGSC 9543 / NRRL 43880) TaxID=246409 RepID=I1C0T7_RHIO9|nr:hypothetical protein RO3G_06772 [Rhizopus delemar RA 99-880]|eukprot:EIE82067.1 hypothetical protein RO3G_06772 [Rhizopus delemar RA 99-880]